MSGAEFILSLVPPMAASVLVGYVWGRGAGEKAGYKLGRHEGEFDALHGIPRRQS